MDKLVFLDPDDLNEIPFTTSKVIAVHGQGHVYIVEADGCVKIGRTKNLVSRINAIRTQSGRNLKRLCFTKPCSNYSDIENSMHALFEKERLNGEWFKTSFEQACNALNSFELDLSKKEEREESSGLFDLFREFDEAYMKRELQLFLDEHPTFKKYLEENGFRLYFCKQTGEITVTDDEDVDMSLRLFTAIYRTQALGGVS
ncbi:hypothetical protein JCM15765_08830 [Paradesulfitobacterium aromaticivorans]